MGVIKLMKSCYYFSDYYFRKKLSERLIRRFDLSAPLNAAGFSLSLKGWHAGSVGDLFGDGFVAQCKEYFDISNKISDRYGSETCREIPIDIVLKIAKNPSLINLVRSYIGDSGRLDDIYFWSKDESKSTAFDMSEGWHTDNVGYRLKLFLCFDSEGDVPKTQLLEGGHRKIYSAPWRDWRRFFGLIGPEPKGRVVSYEHKENAYIIFDTNTFHRGIYHESRGARKCLIVEFISREKSNLLAGTCPCGPGQSKAGQVLFIDGKNSISGLQNSLIDPKLLCADGNNLLYSIKNISSSL